MIDRTSQTAIPKLDKKGLRKFAISTGTIFAALFGLFLPWLFNSSYSLWPWVVFVILTTAGLFFPGQLNPVYYWWMRLALLISKITIPVIMGLLFFMVLTPYGLIAKLFRKDPMNRRLHRTIKTYRVASTQTSRKNLEDPY